MRRGKILSLLQKSSESRLDHQDQPSTSSASQVREEPQPVQRTMGVVQEEQDNFSDWDSWDPMAEDYHSSKNTLALNPDRDPECIITGKAMPDTAGFGKISICNHYSRYGTCADGKYCDRAHVKPANREQVLALQRDYELNKGRTCLTSDNLSPIDLDLDPKLILLVVVSSSKSPNSFYMVAPYDQMNFSNYTQDDIKFYIQRINQSSSVKTKLDKVHEQLSTMFDHDYRIDNVNDNIYLSQIVACKLKDGRFHRALVIETEDISIDKFEYKLLLIDIGIEVELPRESIYDIRAHSLSNPPMAIHCRLNVRPPRNVVGWSKQALDYFTNQVVDKKYWLSKVVSYLKEDSIYTVDLIDIDSRASFTDKFVQSGLADYC